LDQTVADVAFDDAAGETLARGVVLAQRYEILSLVGQGGMGAVYKAHDRELQRDVALKTIRAEVASNRQTLERFKREVTVSSRISHRNVVRVYDLGADGRLRFLTMEFVEGKSLDAVIGPEGLPAESVAPILRQICLGLEAAHEQGVIHRDLKPQNIMIDPQGRVAVMDFGLASTVEGSQLTRAGALMGTPDYMSPEQALGQKLDQRSDIFSLGIIAYEMLTGKAPFRSDTMIASLVARTRERALPPKEINASVPEALSRIVHRCLGRDAAERYGSVKEVLLDLEEYLRTGTVPVAAPGQAPAAGTAAPSPILTPRGRTMSESGARKWIGIAVSITAVALGLLYFIFGRKQTPAAPVAPMTVMIADFNNHTGDSVFSGTLEPTLKLVLEGASFISAYDRTRMKDLGLKAISGTLDEAQAQAIAVNQGLNVVVSGSLDRRGADYQLAARAVQTVTGTVLATADATAPNKDQVLFAVTKLGTAIRQALGDATSESAQRLSMESLSAVSLEAVHEYAAGLDAQSAGRFEETLQHVSRAVDLDPNFGMAYTVMAGASRNLGRFQDAERYIREALKHIDRMTERERYRTRATLYLLTGDQQKCVDEWGALLQRYPSDTAGYTNISICELHLRNLPKSVEAARRAVAILPKRAIYHANLALSFAYSGDSQGAARESAEALKLGYANGYLLMAFASLLQDQPAQAAESYHKFETANASDAATALADLAVYEGHFSDAVTILEKGAAADMAGRKPDPDAAATKFWALANVQLLRNQKGPALAAAKRALDLSQAFQTRFVAAQVYVALGEAVQARELAAGLASEAQIEPQAYAKLIEGEAALKAGDGRGAVRFLTGANNLLDTWIGRFDLGRAYLEMGAFPEADAEFDRCVKRRGEALALFLDLPTYGYLPPVYYYQGRAREGMKSAGFAESYKKYLSIRGQTGEDPLLAEVRTRVPQ
jgi:tetratricopeptide (TPR) repeat protein/tRNA A-37 threonylcarbamoyl transferase component Bud32